MRTRGSADSSALVDLDGWRLGLLICYDVEFPENARALALAGADLIAAPTANMDPYEVVATTLVPARAYENQVYFAYANYCGHEGEISYCGQSCVVAPDGTDAARAGRLQALQAEHQGVADVRFGVRHAAGRLGVQLGQQDAVAQGQGTGRLRPAGKRNQADQVRRPARQDRAIGRCAALHQQVKRPLGRVEPGFRLTRIFLRHAAADIEQQHDRPPFRLVARPLVRAARPCQRQDQQHQRQRPQSNAQPPHQPGTPRRQRRQPGRVRMSERWRLPPLPQP